MSTMGKGVAPERPTGHLLVGPPAGDPYEPSTRRPFQTYVIGFESPLPHLSKRLFSAKTPHCAVPRPLTSARLNRRFGDAHIRCRPTSMTRSPLSSSHTTRRTITMKTLLAFLSIALFSSTAVYAATAKFVKSTPTDDSVSDTPPSAIVLEFSEAVQLHQEK